MLQLPDDTGINETWKIKRRGNNYDVNRKDGSYFPTGGIIESDGLLYLFISTLAGAFEFVFTSPIKVIAFLAKRKEPDDFYDVE